MIDVYDRFFKRQYKRVQITIIIRMIMRRRAYGIFKFLFLFLVNDRYLKIVTCKNEKKYCDERENVVIN